MGTTPTLRIFIGYASFRQRPSHSFGRLTVWTTLWSRLDGARDKLTDVVEVLIDFCAIVQLMAEQITGLKNWTKGRARSATTPNNPGQNSGRLRRDGGGSLWKQGLLFKFEMNPAGGYLQAESESKRYFFRFQTICEELHRER